VAIGGISMGGFGALNLARLDPRRFCAVGGHSAALWASGADSAAGAFDDAADFSRNDVIGTATRTADWRCGSTSGRQTRFAQRTPGWPPS
jgi:S-formylglutathione hydrolase FrmB